ncbi:hypothetical protein [Phenylobacterium conjunctum]|uniref:Uncharacterized protein n=1 Tax=Phenylobacterium conjunctum TaxID=1298959 RepID=A0ABW3SYI5_9CAUL
MTDPKMDDLKKGVALLVAALVKTMDDRDPGASDAFIKRLDEGEYRLKNKGVGVEALEAIGWARENITGFSIISGPGEPLFDD